MTDNHNPNLCNWLCLIHREQKKQIGIKPKTLIHKDKMSGKRHYGNCDSCDDRNVLVYHYNYYSQPHGDFRTCVLCTLHALNEICKDAGKEKGVRWNKKS